MADTVKKGVKKKAAKATKAAAKAKPARSAAAKASKGGSRSRGGGKVPFKKEMRAILLEAKKKLLSELAMKVKNESNALKFEIGDIYDIASSERERELTLMLGDRDRDKLHQIDMALEWLDEKDYGLCEECGEPIGENRLRALPFTRVCVECKSKAEKETHFKGRFEESPLGMVERPESEEEF